MQSPYYWAGLDHLSEEDSYIGVTDFDAPQILCTNLPKRRNRTKVFSTNL